MTATRATQLPRPFVWVFLLAIGASLLHSQAATAPAATLRYKTANPAVIHGGVATIGGSGYIYFSVLSSASSSANVIKLGPTGSVLWTFVPGAGTDNDMYPIPTLDASGSKLYIGSDSGKFYCRSTTDGNSASGWTDFSVQAAPNRRIRSGAALDPNSPLGPTVYFHCNDGYLYALNADTGAQRWRAPTGNAGGPPADLTWNPLPVSSSPVIDSYGQVYVGSADGSVYSFSPFGGAPTWRVVLNSTTVEPVEATPALGANGYLYVATRANTVNGVGGNVYAINRTTHIVAWTHVVGGGPVGFIASPVVDQLGFVYTAHYYNLALEKLDPQSGNAIQSWGLPGKFCQTPTINQNGLLIIGVSAVATGEVNEIAAIKTGDPGLSAPLWVITSVGGFDLGSSFGSPAMLCTAAGRTYFSDGLGKVCQFDTGAPMMAGTWPTFQCGNRRAGKTATYPTIIAELPPFYNGTYTDVRNVDLFGRVVGQSYGSYGFSCSFPGVGYSAALWKNNAIGTPGACYQASPETYATALNGVGDVVGYRTGTYGGALVWPDGANSSTPYLYLATPGFTPAYASDINASGTIIGYAFGGSSVHAFGWTKSGSTWGGGQDLGAPAGGAAYAYALSDTGRIVGQASFNGSGQYHAFVTQSQYPPVGDPTYDMGTLGGTSSVAWDVNDSSGTVGWAQNGSGYKRAFYLQVGSLSLQAFNELPPLPGVSRTDYLSESYGVNRLGEAVGYAHNQSLSPRAFKYVPGGGGTMVDLNTVLPQGSPWVLTRAVSINDAGTIVGTGTFGGIAKSWILYKQCQD